MATTDDPAGDRSAALAEAFIRLTDVLGPSYEVEKTPVYLAQAVCELLSADAVGVLLADRRGHLTVAARAPDTTSVASLFKLDGTDGPGYQAFATGEPVSVPRLHGSTSFPEFSAAANEAGYRAAYSLPMQRRADRIGAVTLLNSGPVSISAADIDLARALTTMATVGILTAQVYRSNLDLTQQLQSALTSRIAIEQAKGLVAAHNSGDLDAAFAVIRTAARNNNLRLTDVANAIISGELSAREMARRERKH